MQARLAKAAHHQEIGVQAPAFCYEYVGNLVFFACRTVFYRIDAVIPGCTASLPFSASDAHLPGQGRRPFSPDADKGGLRQGRADSRLSFHATTTLSNGAKGFQFSGTRKR
jgi:hypothetical protein